MPSRAWKVLPAVAILTISVARAETVGQTIDRSAGPWHHVPSAVGHIQQENDEAKCRLAAQQTPVDSTTPSVVEFGMAVAKINCLTALGYRSGKAVPTAPSPKEEIKSYGSGLGTTSCAEFTNSAIKPEMEAMYFSWTEGMLVGWNLGSPNGKILVVDVSKISREGQMKFVRRFCQGNPAARYVEAAVKLIVELRLAK